MEEVARLLGAQSGVVSRRQVLACGGRPSDIERALRRREWARVLPGVFVDPTGVPTWLAAVLDDVASGSGSVLEHGYLTRVERTHGLPRGFRQVRSGEPTRAYQDVLHAAYDQVVELDGRLHHDAFDQRDRDLDRDLDAAVRRLGTMPPAGVTSSAAASHGGPDRTRAARPRLGGIDAALWTRVRGGLSRSPDAPGTSRLRPCRSEHPGMPS